MIHGYLLGVDAKISRPEGQPVAEGKRYGAVTFVDAVARVKWLWSETSYNYQLEANSAPA